MAKRLTFAAAAALALAAPAPAATWLVTAFGTTNAGAGPPSNTIEGVPFANQPVFAAFIVTSAGNPVSLPPPGGTGTLTRWDDSILFMNFSVGPWTITRTAASTRSSFVVDNGGNPANPALRFDQFSISDGFTFVGSSFFPHLATDAPLPPDVFLSSFSLFRNYSLIGQDPLLIDGPGFPDLEFVIDAPFGARGFSMNFRQGNPTSQAELLALPQVTFGVLGLELFAVAIPGVIPEPGTWAMLIAGFGLVGGMARRRRAAA